MEFNGYLMSGQIPAAEIRNGRVIPIDALHMPLYLTPNKGLSGLKITMPLCEILCFDELFVRQAFAYIVFVCYIAGIDKFRQNLSILLL